ncbi:hypothetical protein A9Q91_00300 [Candidatus Gracilibacteria bacterium 28_42_T64]|nr:hypothetical protein A9Q91_00300 [Candidatus Gracilibacteria bacterium 28_42_T64]
MIKSLDKISYAFLFACVSSYVLISKVFAAAPTVNCIGLPGCADTDVANPIPSDISKNIGTTLVTNIISQMIQYVAVVAVISLMLSGVMYLVSGGEEEKTKRAKSWIMWSLVGVFMSIFAYGIVKIVNNFSI